MLLLLMWRECRADVKAPQQCSCLLDAALLMSRHHPDCHAAPLFAVTQVRGPVLRVLKRLVARVSACGGWLGEYDAGRRRKFTARPRSYEHMVCAAVDNNLVSVTWYEGTGNSNKVLDFLIISWDGRLGY